MAKQVELLQHPGQAVLIKAQVKYVMQQQDTNILPTLLLKQTNQLLALPEQTEYVLYCVL